jgi:hypothetical protein
MFRIVPNPTFKAPVQLTVPGAEAPEVVTFEFRHLDVRAYTTWADRALEQVFKQGEAADVAAILDEVIAGWSGIGGVDGKPLPYACEHLAAMLGQYHAAGFEIATAYRKALRDARSKN